MAHEADDPAFRRLIEEHAPLRQVGAGFKFTEGPIWRPAGQYLLFSDMPGDVRRRLDRTGVREGSETVPQGPEEEGRDHVDQEDPDQRHWQSDARKDGQDDDEGPATIRRQV